MTRDEPLVPTRRSSAPVSPAARPRCLAACDADDAPGADLDGARRPRRTRPRLRTSARPSAARRPAGLGSVRAQFNLDPALAQFAAFVLSPHTKVLDAAIAGYRDQLGTDTERRCSRGHRPRGSGVRAAAAAYHGGAPGQYALTDSTTMGIATYVRRPDARPGDEVLTTTHDFYSTEEASGCSRAHRRDVRRVTLYDDPAAPPSTRWSTGCAAASRRAPRWWRSPGCTPAPACGCRWRRSARRLAGLSRVPRDQYVVCVDGVHGFSAVDVDLPDLGCDFLAAGTHKWLFGPRGTGILWGRDWAPLTELIPTFVRRRDAGRPAHRRAATTPSSTDGRSRTRSASWPGSAATGGGPHPRAGHPAQGGAGRHRGLTLVTPMDPDGLRRHRLLRRRRAAPAGTPC